MNKLIKSIEDWAYDKNICNQVTQASKTVSESSELLEGCIKNDKTEIIDGIGDVLVTIIIQADIQGVTLEHCLEHAWNEIKDRKGKTVNGLFIKDK